MLGFGNSREEEGKIGLTESAVPVVSAPATSRSPAMIPISIGERPLSVPASLDMMVMLLQVSNMLL